MSESGSSVQTFSWEQTIGHKIYSLKSGIPTQVQKELGFEVGIHVSF